jgi:hypothetical protein
MGKKSVSWPDFLKIKFEEMKKNKPTLQFKEILQDASVKTEWKKITDGSHPDYEKGAMVRKAKSPKKASSSSSSSPSASTSSSSDTAAAAAASAQDILKDCDLCRKCTKKIHAYLNKKTGGSPATIQESTQKTLLQGEAAVDLHAGGGGSSSSSSKRKKNTKKRGGCGGTCGPLGGGGGKKKKTRTHTRRHRK